MFSVCSVFLPRCCLVASELMHFAPFLHDFSECIVILCGRVNMRCIETSISSKNSAALLAFIILFQNKLGLTAVKVDILEIQGFHLIATVAMTAPVSLTVIVIRVRGSGQVLNVLALTHIHLTSSLSQLCVCFSCFLSIWL